MSMSTATAQTTTSVTTPDDESMLLIQSLGLKDELPKPGYNTEGGSVFDNYVKAQRDGQFFLLEEGNIQYETPLSASVEVVSLLWCSNLHFTSSNNGTYTRGIGYTAQCVKSFLGDTKLKFDTLGGQLPSTITADTFSITTSLSASYNTQSNMFNMVYHNNNDNNVWQFTDTGLSTMSYLGWETHDEGDVHPNADTSSWPQSGQMKWLSTEEAALFVVTDFNQVNFNKIYEKIWNDEHQVEVEETEERSTIEEEGSEFETKGYDESSASSSGRRLIVAATSSMFLTLLGSSV